MSRLLRRIALGLALLSAWCAPRALAEDPKPLRVVTTIPDLADIVRQIGGERVEVVSICKGRENLHAVSAKPSHVVAISRADLFVEVGLSLESSFVPGLLENSGNARVRPGGAGFVNVSEGWEAIEVPANVSRQGGDVHPQGNPHMNLDPRAGRWMADKVHAALVRVDPGSKSLYDERNAAYVKRLDDAQARWQAWSAKWKGRKIVQYHQEFSYFTRAYGIEVVGHVESKPGIPPTPNHVAELIATIRSNEVPLILLAPWAGGSTVERIAKQTGAAAIEAPNQCGSLPKTDGWIEMMDELHRRVARGLSTETP